jgi:hypothetical protein
MCRLIQVLILVYGIGYLMIYKKGYQETDTSIISSITLKVKVTRRNLMKRRKKYILFFNRVLVIFKQEKIKH